MAGDNKPVIFLAFANDRDDQVRYLRNLPEEARQLREAFQRAEHAGLCEVVIRQNCTARDIFQVFQDESYRNRVAIFHFAGHANGHQILLESSAGTAAAAQADGLASFLGEQRGLQLVFLNGCSTRKQASGLLANNVNCVISTARAIDDAVATDFARMFYEGLGSGATMRSAFAEAQGAVLTQRGQEHRLLYHVDEENENVNMLTDSVPWAMEVRPGVELVDEWNLAFAAGSPLYNLPQLPVRDLPASPYRYLHRFTRHEAELFFGRGREIRELYDRITDAHGAPVILFYGQSGVGKSSLLDAGVFPRLEADHEVRYLRRDHHQGLLGTLRLAFLPECAEVPLAEAWRKKEQVLGKPLIVFLDQIEEIYTRPHGTMSLEAEIEELLAFFRSVFSKRHRCPQGKLVLSFRKEWLAEIERLAELNSLPTTKLFLPPLDRNGVLEIINGPTTTQRLRDKYAIEIDDELPETIATHLLGDPESAVAPTLQVLLAKMWDNTRDANTPVREFTLSLYQHLKDDGILLRDFLSQQIKRVRKHSPKEVQSGLLLDFLVLHTTALGTSNQCSLDELKRQYPQLGENFEHFLRDCQDLHLITVTTVNAGEGSPRQTRLAHDTLAPLVRERFDNSAHPGQRARRILENRRIEWEQGRTGNTLDDADLKVVEQGLSGTRKLDDAEQRLLDASRHEQGNRQRTSQFLKYAAAAAMLTITILGGFWWWKYREAESLRVESNGHAARAFWQIGVSHRTEDAGVAAEFNFLESARLSETAGEPGPAHNTLFAAQSVDSVKRCFLHKGNIRGAAFSPDKKHVITWSNDQTLNVWRTDRELPLMSWAHDGYINGARFSEDGSRVLSWTVNGKVHVWQNQKATALLTLTHESRVLGAQFVGNDHQIISWSADGAVKLWNATTGDSVISWKHGDKLQGAVVFKDDLRVLTWSDDMAVKLWNNKQAEALVTWQHESDIQGVKFNRDGSRVLSWSNDGSLNLWNIKASVPLATWKHQSRMLGASFSSNESTILSWCNDGEIHLWDVSETTPLVTWTHDANISGAMFNLDETRVLSWSGSGSMRMWDLTHIDPVISWTNQGAINGASFNKMGTRILSWSTDGSVKLWDVAHGQPLTTWRHTGGVAEAFFNHNETEVLSWSFDGAAMLWDVAQAEPLMSWQQETSEFNFFINGALFNKDSTQILSWNGDEQLQLWDVGMPEPSVTWTHQGRVNGASFSNDATKILSWGADGNVYLWPSTNRQPLKTWEHGSVVTGAVLTRDESKLLSWSRDGNVKLWNTRESEPLLTWKHESIVTRAILSPDESRVFSWSQDGTANLWDMARQTPVTSWKNESRVIGAQFSQNGQQILVWKDNGMVNLWDTAQTSPVKTWMHEGGEVNGAMFDSAFTRVLSWGADGAVNLWDVNADEPLMTWTHEAAVNGAQFTQNETQVISWSADGSIRQWDVSKSDLLRTWHHRQEVQGALLIKDDTQILSWSDDGQVNLWDITKASPLVSWMHDSKVNGAAFSKNGAFVLSWSNDGEMRLWNAALHYADLNPAERMMDLQARSGMKLHSSGQLVRLSMDEWTNLVQSPDYQRMKMKKQREADTAPLGSR